MVRVKGAGGDRDLFVRQGLHEVIFTKSVGPQRLRRSQIFARRRCMSCFAPKLTDLYFASSMSTYE